MLVWLDCSGACCQNQRARRIRLHHGVPAPAANWIDRRHLLRSAKAASAVPVVVAQAVASLGARVVARSSPVQHDRGEARGHAEGDAKEAAR